ncbi:PS_pyruv_trans domain-containing protein [Vibrio chagasii]|nr:PS_pyruv_trans domain-containing protein [Vibrio chagasii]
MKKVGLINFQYSNHNYGAVLQAAALSEYINNNLGVPAEHINYIPDFKVSGMFNKSKKFLKKIIFSLGLLESEKIDHEAVVNKETFENFRTQWLPRTDVVYTSLDKLKSSSFLYSHVVVGSDQVWRPSYAGAESLVYFLSFLNDGIKKVSYAASFGTDSWDLDEVATAKISNEVNRFSAISVRESSGVDLCRDVFGINAQHVLDPTLLVGRDFFNKVCASVEGDKHSGIVYYKLDKSDDFLNLLSGFEAQLGTDSKDIYFDNINGKSSYHNVENWLAYIKSSKFVITDSYHCVCFAILFNKPFLCYPNSTRGLARIHSLLKLLGLEKQFYDGISSEQTLAELMVVDYEKVEQRLTDLRCESSAFLKLALEIDE